MAQQEEGKRATTLTTQQLIDDAQEGLDITLQMYHAARGYDDSNMATYARAGVVFWVNAIRFWEDVLKQEQKNDQS